MSLALPGRHAPHPFLETRDGCLAIDGRSILDIAAQAGRTPFYVYARRYMTERVAQLRAAIPPEIRLHYAIKANPMPAVVDHVAGLVDGLDVASGGEMRIALDCGMEPERVSFAGPGKTSEELRQATAAGININIESEREIQVLGDIGRGCPARPRVAVRVNPEFELKTSGMKMAGGPKPFGIDSERVPEALARIANLPLDFVGFHIFTGSQNLRAEALIEAHQRTAELAIRLARNAPSPVRELNIGGGFGIPYFPGDRPLDIELIGRNLRTLLPDLRRHMPEAEIILELGRYLVGEAGVYICRILDRKISRGHTYLVTDGGLHHHLAASGNFGQVIRKNYPVLVANRIAAEQLETVSAVGPLCTPLDVLADRTELPRAEPGDLIAVLQSGAYGLTASPVRFLSHPEPLEILI